jgi:protoporphyrinogen oxidase
VGKAIIIGAGPAGLTAAYELLTRTEIVPIVLEASDQVGGLSRTVNHRGNRMDIGGHRFFSKSDRVMEWWFQFLPLQAMPETGQNIFYQGKFRPIAGEPRGPDPAHEDCVMLLRPRSSRIYYLKKLFRYPIEPSFETLLKLGFIRSFLIFASYLWAALFPPKRIENLEDFFVSRFGRKLYETFFKTYTEKVWGVRCKELSAEWGAQRVKSLSISRALWHAVRKRISFGAGPARKKVETSLIEQFLYPKFGPGQMWETVAAEVERRGGTILKGMRVTRIELTGSHVARVGAVSSNGETHAFDGDHFFSTMPIKDLVGAMTPRPPEPAATIAEGLLYRDFVTVGVLLEKLKIGAVGYAGTVRDNWIYIHEPGVQAGRLQIFNNWSPWMVRDPGTVWVGVEYFCQEGDGLWSLPDSEMSRLTVEELRKIGLMDEAQPLDSVVVRMPKAYPAYRGTYGRFDELRSYLDSIENLHLIGRNGMHRYNNQDHSMLAAMTAVDHIVTGGGTRADLWSVNSEEDYHEVRAVASKRR